MKAIRLFAALVLMGPSIRAQTPAPAPAPATAPAIFCEQPVFDFGVADNSQTVSHEYVIVNRGDATLEISQVRPSCGCTVANISQRSVPPGGEARVTAQLNLTGRQGPQHKAITVESNDPKQPQLTLMLQGTAGAAVNIQPPQVMFGQLQSGSEAVVEVEISAGGDKNFQITGVEAGSAQLQTELRTRTAGRAYTVVIRTKPPLGQGVLSAAVRVNTDHPDRPAIDIPVSGLVVGDLIVAPTAISLSEQPGQPVTRFVILRSAANKPFQITGIDTPEAAMTTEVMPFGENGYRIQINNVVPSKDLNGKSLRIGTSLDTMRDVFVPFAVLPPAGG